MEKIEQKCGAADAEYFVFNENGTFEAGRSKKAEAVGFWQIDGDIVYLVFIESLHIFYCPNICNLNLLKIGRLKIS